VDLARTFAIAFVTAFIKYGIYMGYLLHALHVQSELLAVMGLWQVILLLSLGALGCVAVAKFLEKHLTFLDRSDDTQP